MTTTPEKIAQLRRLHAESAMVAGPHYRKAACEELPRLLDDLEAAQAQVKVLREALEKIMVGACPASVQAQRLADNLEAVCHEVYDISRAALAATEVKP
jgi:hypothetical protein